MTGSVFDYPAFRPFSLLLCLMASAILFASWLWWPQTQTWWHNADVAVFRALNGSLRDRLLWQQFWAVANNHFFDFLAVLLMLWLAFSYATAEHKRFVQERVSVLCTMAVVLAVALLATDVMDDSMRRSPTAALGDVVLLSEHIRWLQTKDIAYNSYPSDHATVLLAMAMMLWHFAGRRMGLIMLAAAVFFTFPRLIGGAHWFSDVFAGSVPLVLGLTSLFIHTPLHRAIIRLWMRLWQVPFFAALLEAGTFREAPLLVLKGCCMGAADIVPGVSGGTMAYILGIWHRLIAAIKSFDLGWLRLVLRLRLTEAVERAHLSFLAPLLLGIGLAVLTFTRFIPIPALLQAYPEPIYGLFFGLIAGSILLLLVESGAMIRRELGIFILGIAGGWLLVNMVPVETPETPWFVFLCGCIAISAMLLPGISGSFILLILGKYAYILGAVGSFDFSVILPFAAGCLVGLVLFSRGASWLLEHYHRACVIGITGILIGSLWVIWPFQQRLYTEVHDKPRLISSSPYLPEQLDGSQTWALVMMAIGLLCVWQLGRIAARRQLTAMNDEHTVSTKG
jgi:putative membrane protein